MSNLSSDNALTGEAGTSTGGYRNGPYIAQVIDVLDSEKMGSLKVYLVAGSGESERLDTSTEITVRYMSPFFGSTSYEAMDGNNRMSSSTQSTYGMWFVPPDIGNRVMVVFVEGDLNRGYWIGCIPQRGANHMVPAIASSTSAELTPQERTKIGTDDVPVMEVNRRLKGQRIDDIDKVKRPMHPFAMRLATQGLLKDTIRGVTTSSARRKPLGSTYGIITPGPPVVGGKKWQEGPSNAKYDVYAEREGGQSFVMDDGVIFNEKSGKSGITDELVRIRTRTGHQILLHNSADLIYICNSRGTAWLEFTSDGKIDVYAADSVSIHTEQDFNFRADRDINLEAGKNINMRSVGTTHIEAGGFIEGYSAGDVMWTAAKNVNVKSGGRIRITSTGLSTSPTHAGVLSGIDIKSVLGNVNIYSTTELKMQSLTTIAMRATATLSAQAGGAILLDAGATTTINSLGANYITAGVSNIFKSTVSHIERAPLIDMNGPTPAVPSPSLGLLTAIGALIAAVPEGAVSVSTLEKNSIPSRTRDRNATPGKVQQGWENGNYYRETNLSSIMTRVPSHEPYDAHEDLGRDRYVPEKTDRGG